MENRIAEILKVVVENGVVELEEVVKLVEEGISVDMFNEFIGGLQFLDEEVAERISTFINDHLDEIKNGVKLEDIVKNDNEGIFDVYDVELARKIEGEVGYDKKIVITCGVGDVNITDVVESMVVDIKNNISEITGKEVTSTEEKSAYEIAVEKGYKGTENEFINGKKTNRKECEYKEFTPEEKYDMLDEALSEPIEDKLTKIREDIEKGEIEELPSTLKRLMSMEDLLNTNFGKSLAAILANDLEQTKAMMHQHGCNCCCDLHDADVYNEEDIEEQHGSIDLGNGYSIEKIRKDNIEDELANLPYGFKESSKEDIEEQVNDICEKIKCDDDRTKIACIVSDIINWEYLIDGINCNIIPIGVLNSTLIINVGLNVKDVKIDKSMMDISDVIVVYEDEYFNGTNEVSLYKLIGAGLAIVIPIEEIGKTLEFSPVEFRGITKLVEYSEMSKLLN